MTFNQGQENVSCVKDSPELVFPNAKDYDMIAVCAQECKSRYKRDRLQELEDYLGHQEFVVLNKEFPSMWEMWFICFVK